MGVCVLFWYFSREPHSITITKQKRKNKQNKNTIRKTNPKELNDADVGVGVDDHGDGDERTCKTPVQQSFNTCICSMLAPCKNAVTTISN